MILYLHIPFCDSKCGYCAFYSQTNQKHLFSPYIKALEIDLKYQLEYYSVKSIESVFIGGGTPNILDSKAYKQIFTLINPLLVSGAEVSIEANVNLISKSWCDDLVSLGANRLSVGVQSFYEDKLELLERKHKVKDIAKSLELASSFKNKSIDLIYDTALDSLARLKHELDCALQLDINHISCYSLSIDKDSSFGLKNANHKASLESQSSFIKQLLESYGAFQYEVSNFALPYKCKHNLAYWEGKDYLGVGASSVSKIDIKPNGASRLYASKDLSEYIKHPTKRVKEPLSEADLQTERLFLGLRSEVGVSTKDYSFKLLESLKDKIYIKGDHFFAKDLFLADEIALWLLRRS
ncbi:radical SAM family heme chaperone HemW [Helicobacter sp. 11S02629-2]|uniref:radical SAM family heme chaperone HemW n=1 Tax=Helicobacter sp. 11S02629-2 TaxID=1476195 RepID=UPI000BA72994|nr:radical SAM family heme chaperone HemW [Helicobacter sp. 11S02629-2]PAF41789.1 hypothetical protein BKH40_08245 [Helicobacter sp. 11S02629-2]